MSVTLAEVRENGNIGTILGWDIIKVLIEADTVHVIVKTT